MEKIIKKSGEKQHLQKEYQILKQLEEGTIGGHHCFPIAYRYQEEEEKAVLFIKRIYGNTLTQVSKSSSFKRSQWIQWMKETSSGIAYLHSQRPAIIWCDCKPDNLIVDKEGHIHLIDFDHACYLLKEIPQYCYGTKGYCAPEQLNGELLDERTDIYGFGATFLRLPIQWNWFSIRKILKKCVEPRKESRFQTMEEILYELKQL